MTCTVLDETPREIERPRVDLLVALDFDGTISSIAASPEQAELHPLAESLLELCASTPRVAVAVISGREIDEVRERVKGLATFVAGSHGLTCATGSGDLLWTTPAACPALPAELERLISDSGLRLEPKQHAMALHYRGVDHDTHRSVLGAFEEWALSSGLQIIPGRKVLEATLPGASKCEALRRIAAHTGALRVTYAGDDQTDLDALTYAAGSGRAFFVESRERLAPANPLIERVADIPALCYALSFEVATAARGAAVLTFS